MNSNNRQLSFVQKVRQGEKTTLYELLPLPRHLSKRDLAYSLSFLTRMLADFSVDAVNIPEVREETRNGDRGEAEIKKMEPRVLGSYLQQYPVRHVIVNRPIVYLPWEEQEKWLSETYTKFTIATLILVGGESSKVDYPGLSVESSARKIRQLFPEIFLGGITIPTRKGEAERVWQKSEAGIEFFTTQILYESAAVKQFLKDYWVLCKEKKTEPKMIFLSFAPVSTTRDMHLLSWLDVEISETTENLLKIGWLGMSGRSLHICQEVLEDILEFVENEKIAIPLGLNVEHVNRHNIELSFLLLKRLSKVYSTYTI